MQLITWLDDLFQHMRWADALVWQAVLATPQAENDARLRELLYHIHLTQHAFLRLWSDSPRQFPKSADFQNLATLSKWGKEYHDSVAGYLGVKEDLKLDRTVVVPWAKYFEQQLGGPPNSTSLAEMMTQVVLHSIYHRGQVNARLREVGGEPPLCDFIAWLWRGRPHLKWPGMSES